MIPAHWNDAKTYLSQKDKVMRAIIASYPDAMVMKEKPFETLARAIVGQQISVKAADSVWKKFEAAIGKITPDNVANCPHDILRPCGLSERKVIYMHSLASHFLDNKAQIAAWPRLDDEAIIKELVTIKGIGRWTAEMFLIFGLGRPDVFPLDDLGLLKGIYRHYNDGREMSLAKVKKIGEGWRPYRSVGTWYMWRVLDPVPVEY